MLLNTLTTHELLDLIKEKKTTPQAIHQSVLDQIKKSDKDVNAVN